MNSSTNKNIEKIEINEVIDQKTEIINLKDQLKKIKIEKKVEVKLKKCKLCGIEKELDKFALDRVIDNKTIRLKTKCLDCYKVISSKYYNDKKAKTWKKIHDDSEKKKKKYEINLTFNDINDLEKSLEGIKLKFNNNDNLDDLLIKRKEYKPRGKKPNNGGGNNIPPAMNSNWFNYIIFIIIKLISKNKIIIITIFSEPF